MEEKMCVEDGGEDNYKQLCTVLVRCLREVSNPYPITNRRNQTRDTMSKEEINQSWVVDMNLKFANKTQVYRQEQAKWNKTSIYKVPHLISHLDKDMYKPRVVSIGPFHHGTVHLMPMEAHKQRTLLQFLDRSNLPLQTLYDMFLAMSQDLMDSYESLVWNDTTNKFVEMMIMDGCFILEIIWAAHRTDNKDDPVFGEHGKSFIMPFVRCDMLMLENQLPLLVLSKLISCIPNDSDQACIDKLYGDILRFCNPGMTFPSGKFGECSHVLELYRKSLLLPEPTLDYPAAFSATSPNHQEDDDNDVVVRPATELDEANIHFRKSKTKSLRDISFEGGYLRLPEFVVDDSTNSIFLNLIAFERCHAGVGQEIISFVILMDNLIDNAEDIGILSEKGIIRNKYGSDENAARLFNEISEDLTVHPRCELKRVQREIFKYCQKPWNKHRASFIHTYLRNPWALISIVAAAFLFILTIMQTVYSALQYQQGVKPR